MTDAELDEFNAANDTIHRLLYGEEGARIERSTQATPPETKATTASVGPMTST